jgi:integrase
MAGKRAVGEGTIYRRKDGRWEVALKCQTTAGTRKRIRAYAATRAEADEKLTELKHQLQRGVPVPDKNWRLGAYLDYWLENVVRIDRRPATQELYETTIRLNLKPGLGRYPLRQLTVPIVQGFVNQQLDEGHFSLRKVQIMRTVLSAALTNALREELVSRNVARLVKFREQKLGKKIMPWTVDEIRAFMASAATHPYFAAFVLTAVYGMRRGEVLGLRWHDVDFEKDELHIRQQLQRLGVGLIIGPVKTEAGERDFRLLEMAREALLARCRVQASVQYAAGPSWQGLTDDEALVFTSDAGCPIEPKNYSRSFKRLCKANGLRDIRLHDMRHSQATLLKDLGVLPRDAQLILGHASL